MGGHRHQDWTPSTSNPTTSVQALDAVLGCEEGWEDADSAPLPMDGAFHDLRLLVPQAQAGAVVRRVRVVMQHGDGVAGGQGTLVWDLHSVKA